MKVGVNGRTFMAETPGGSVQVGLDLTSEFVEAEAYDVTVYGAESLCERFEDWDVVSRYFSLESQMYGLVWERTCLPALLDDDVDVLFCPNGNAPAHSTAVPTVMYIHDVNALRGFSSRLHRLYRKAAVPRGATASDAVVTVSEFSKREIVSHLGLPRSKVHVVPNGLKSIYHSDEPGTSFDTPENYVLYVGSMNPRKNVSGLVEGFRRANNALDEEYRLLLVGPGNKSVFKELSLDDGDDIVKPGFISDSELKYAYQNASAFLFPSHHEGFGLPPLEAMACGTPVVASREGALPEVLGTHPEYVDADDTADIGAGLERVLRDGPADEALASAQRHAREYTWERASSELADVFEAVA